MHTEFNPEKNIPIRINCASYWRLDSLEPLPGHQLAVTFMDGTHGIVKMQNFIFHKNAGVFSKLQNENFFKQVKVVHGAATWPGEIDLAPDAMYDAIKADGVWVVK